MKGSVELVEGSTSNGSYQRVPGAIPLQDRPNLTPSQHRQSDLEGSNSNGGVVDNCAEPLLRALKESAPSALKHQHNHKSGDPRLAEEERYLLLRDDPAAGDDADGNARSPSECGSDGDASPSNKGGGDSAAAPRFSWLQFARFCGSGLLMSVAFLVRV